jgi:hypothetical protein
MIEKITLDMLTQDSVSIKKQQYIVQNGVEYPVGQPWRSSYVNSTQGRQEVENEVAEPYKTIIFMMWGDTATIEEIID